MPRRKPLAKSEEVADYFGLSTRTLDDWAYRGIGPRFSKIGHQRRYDWRDVEAYQRTRVQGGSEPERVAG